MWYAWDAFFRSHTVQVAKAQKSSSCLFFGLAICWFSDDCISSFKFIFCSQLVSLHTIRIPLLRMCFRIIYDSFFLKMHFHFIFSSLVLIQTPHKSFYTVLFIASHFSFSFASLLNSSIAGARKSIDCLVSGDYFIYFTFQYLLQIKYHFIALDLCGKWGKTHTANRTHTYVQTHGRKELVFMKKEHQRWFTTDFTLPFFLLVLFSSGFCNGINENCKHQDGI